MWLRIVSACPTLVMSRYALMATFPGGDKTKNQTIEYKSKDCQKHNKHSKIYFYKSWSVYFVFYASCRKLQTNSWPKLEPMATKQSSATRAERGQIRSDHMEKSNASSKLNSKNNHTNISSWFLFWLVICANIS